MNSLYLGNQTKFTLYIYTVLRSQCKFHTNSWRPPCNNFSLHQYKRHLNRILRGILFSVIWEFLCVLANANIIFIEASIPFPMWYSVFSPLRIHAECRQKSVPVAIFFLYYTRITLFLYYTRITHFGCIFLLWFIS